MNLEFRVGRRAPSIVVMAATSVTVLLVGCAVPRLHDEAAAGASSTGPRTVVRTAVDGASERLEPIVAAWPAEYSATGTKSEPLYTESIDSVRDGDVFAVRIDVVAQGDAALGIQNSAVTVDADGRIEWLTGCPKSGPACADDKALRGFLSAAALLSAQRRGHLPETGVARSLFGTAVVCVDDAALHPDSPPAVLDLQPCFSRSTGALLGHYGVASNAFVGATLAKGFTDEARSADALIDSIVP